MHEKRFAEQFLLQLAAGEFDGRLYRTILSFSAEERRQIASLCGSHDPRIVSSEFDLPEPKRSMTPGGTDLSRGL